MFLGTNDPFVTIGLGKEKFQTSVVEKTQQTVDWMEQCELSVNNNLNNCSQNFAAISSSVIHNW